MRDRESFWGGPTYGVITAMKARGNQPGLIAQWIALAHQWALDHRGPEADAMRKWLPLFQARPFYNAAELAPMWPALVVALGLLDRPPIYSPGRLANELDFGGLPVLHRDDGGVWFRNPLDRSKIERYYIVERIHHWRHRKLTQGAFEGEFQCDLLRKGK